MARAPLQAVGHDGGIKVQPRTTCTFSTSNANAKLGHPIIIGLTPLRPERQQQLYAATSASNSTDVLINGYITSKHVSNALGLFCVCMLLYVCM